MNAEEILAQLASEGFNRDRYWVGTEGSGRPCNDCFCLEQEAAAWRLY